MSAPHTKWGVMFIAYCIVGTIVIIGLGICALIIEAGDGH